MAFSYNKKNLANTTIAGAITPTQTSVTVADATVFSYAFFYATLMPSNEMSNASNSEIVLVTNIQGNTLTLVRGQENTIARSFPYGAVITNGIYTRDIDYARSIGRKVFMAQDDGTDNTNTSYQITDPMIKNIPEEGSIITVEFDTPSYGAPTLGVNNGVGGLVQVSGKNIHITDSSGQIDSVEICGDTEQTTYSGKNLANYNTSGTNNFNIGDVEAGKTYTVSFDLLGTISGDGGLSLKYGSSGSTIATWWQPPAGHKKYTFTATTSAILYYNAWGTGSSAGSNNIMLEEGSEESSYEPYVGGTASPNPDYPQAVKTVTGGQTITVTDGDSNTQTFAVDLSKNLFTSTNISGVTDAFTDNHYSSSTTRTTARDWIKLKAGTYTFNATTGTGKTLNISVVTANTDGSIVIIPGITGQWMSLPAAFTINQDILWKMNLRFSDNSNISPVDISNIQLEKGSTATTYTPPVELCKIGTCRDYIYKSGNDWYLHKELSKWVVDSIDNEWNLDSAGGFIRFYRYRDNIVMSSSRQTNGLMSDKFTPNTANGYYNTFYANGYIMFYAWQGGPTTLAQLGTYVSSNPITAYYPLATPTDTQITDATLISQLNALYNMLPEGVADVVVTGDIAGSLTIKYYQQGTGTYTAPIVGGAEIDGGDNEQVVELDSYLPYRLVYDTNGYWRVLNKGPKVTTGAIADGAVTPSKLSVDPGKYSTAETIVGSWIDGRPVYRKVLTGTTPDGTGTINHGISNFSRILKVGGWVQSGSFGSQPIQRVLPDALGVYGIGVGDFTSTTFLFQVGSSDDVKGKPYTIILEYIKTV